MFHIFNKKFVKKLGSLDRFLAVLVLIGGLVSVVSLFRGIVMSRQVEVEYLHGGVGNNSEATKSIFVDIEGSVINPGVYEMNDNSRIKDVLVMAGGLSSDADRDFCEKNINLAEKIIDGQKIYIPSLNNTNAPQGYSEAMLSSKMVNINSASIAELDTLWGIGVARAESIVKNRPYSSVNELVSKGVLSQSLVDRNKDMMSVY